MAFKAAFAIPAKRCRIPSVGTMTHCLTGQKCHDRARSKSFRSVVEMK
jgi:hypothetical protein